jgi:hypothetical protein
LIFDISPRLPVDVTIENYMPPSMCPIPGPVSVSLYARECREPADNRGGIKKPFHKHQKKDERRIKNCEACGTVGHSTAVGVRRVIGDGKASLEDDNGAGSVHVFDGGEALAVQAGAEGDEPQSPASLVALVPQASGWKLSSEELLDEFLSMHRVEGIQKRTSPKQNEVWNVTNLLLLAAKDSRSSEIKPFSYTPRHSMMVLQGI